MEDRTACAPSPLTLYPSLLKVPYHKIKLEKLKDVDKVSKLPMYEEIQSKNKNVRQLKKKC